MKMWGILLIFIVSALFGCNGKEGTASQVIEKNLPVITIEEAMSKLPCFRCHHVGEYFSNKRGSFPHLLHAGLNIHCNQCHSVVGHEPVRINADTCSGCHSMSSFRYSASGLTVNFDHRSHMKGLDCKECHPGIFLMKKGAQRITMAEINKGEYCGACHNGKRAFSAEKCDKCHKG